jgi:spore coat polysaccharide biosynthesis predicted glycosyltransferase SpsG
MSRKGTIATVCRFGGKHGWGHLTRSSALMKRSREMGWQTELWTSNHSAELLVDQRSAFDAIEQVEQYDFDAFAAKGLTADAVFVDEMYLPDAFYESARAFVDTLPDAKLVAMDDMGERTMAAVDLVVNTELGLREARYEAIESALGESYCLIRKGFENPTKGFWSEESDLIPVLVMIGGTDPYDYAFDVLDALRIVDDRSFAPMVVCGDDRNTDKLRTVLSSFSEYRLDIGLDDFEMARLVATCSFGVIGCGSSLFEFGALKVPFVGLCVADNQESSAKRIEEMWSLPIVRSKQEAITMTELAVAIRSIVVMLETGEAVEFGEIDLLGTQRVMRRIESLWR